MKPWPFALFLLPVGEGPTGRRPSWGFKGGRRPLTCDDRLAMERGLNPGRQDSVDSPRDEPGAQRWWRARCGAAGPTTPGMLAVEPATSARRRGPARSASCARGACRARCSRCKGLPVQLAVPRFRGEAVRGGWRGPFCCNACPSRVGGGCRHPYRYYQGIGPRTWPTPGLCESGGDRLRPRGVRGAIT